MTEDQLKKIFSEYMTIPDGVDWAAVKYQEVEGWDSVAHMSLISEMEDQFDIMLDIDDVIDMSSYHKAIEILARYGQSVEP